jgi:hypothetical protein
LEPVWIAANQLGLQLAPVIKCNNDFICMLDDVIVCQDEAPTRVDHNA